MDTGEQTYPRRGIEGWKTDHKSLSDLPFQYYVSVFDPHDFEALDEPVTGDLHDDFADIYGDLWHGLQIYRAGNIQAALSRWVDSYFYHWGHHASSALRAIDHYYCQEKLANEDRE